MGVLARISGRVEGLFDGGSRYFTLISYDPDSAPRERMPEKNHPNGWKAKTVPSGGIP